MATEAQIAANRANSLRSTGPRSIAGKCRSRANAIKHGLCASTVVIEDAEAILQRSLECFYGLKPQNAYQVHLTDQVALASLRVDRCQRLERRARDKVCLKAILTWDEDRKLEAEVLARRLSGDPAAVVGALRRTPHGCDWLIGRWELLAKVAGRLGAWDDDQVRLAADLLGTPREFRKGLEPGAMLGAEGDVVDSAAGRIALASGRVAELKEHREVVAELDEVERALAEADLSDGTDPEVKRLRRYEAAQHRQVRWCVAHLRDPSPHKYPRPDLTPCWPDETEPAPLPEPEPLPEPTPAPKSADEKLAEGWKPEMIHPPFELEPEEYPEPGQVADVPAILESRKQKKLAKAESRRESRRRKLDRLRA